MSKELLAVTTDSFEEEVLSQECVLVDFWAEWCGPCKMMMPVVMEVAEDCTDQVRVVTLNVDEHPEIAAQYGVRGIPTLMLFQQGKVEGTKVGMLTKSQLVAFMSEHVST